MKTIAHVLLAAIVSSGLMALPLHAEEPVQRYIVVLKQHSSAVPDVASLGGKIEFRQDDQLVVTIPTGALAALKADPKVRYVEQVGGTPSNDEAPLIGVPSDPRPGPSPAPRFTPHALGSLAWDSGTYAYDGAGNIVSIGTDNYLYDGVQRLRESSTKGTPESYTYDGFGNMKTRTNTMIPTIQPSTNRYDGYGYNEVGAVTSDGSYAFSYDALGQPLSKIYNNDSSKLEYYIYTPSDERIAVQRGGWWTWSVRDEGGKVLRQYKSSATNPTAPALWLEDFVWRDGLLLGSQRPVEMGGRRHFHLDHLGTPRLVTSDNGQMVSYHDYYPFGDEHSPVSQEVAGGFDREDPMKFTGHERDYAGGMGGEDGHAIDDMHARYFAPMTGRFLSPDPKLGESTNPQSWNRYAYVMNNPIDHIDPTGKAPKFIGRIVEIVIANVPGLKTIAKVETKEELKLAAKAGEDIQTTRRTAKDLARELGGGKEPMHHGPKNGLEGHYHVAGHPDGFGHFFYSMVPLTVGLIASHIPYVGWVVDAPDVGEGADANPHIDARANQMYGKPFYELSTEQKKDVSNKPQ